MDRCDEHGALAGTNDWRLPNIIDTGTSGCNFAYTGTDCGYNVNLATSEMAHMFYSTLGNTGYYNTSGTATGCSATTPPYCLTNDGPFSNLQPNSNYWSGATYAPNTSLAWNFYFGDGSQFRNGKTSELIAWAVRPGDIAAVPAPGAMWLLGTGVAALMLRRRAMTALG